MAVVNIRYATLSDIQDILKFSKDIKEKQALVSEIDINEKDASLWLADCIIASGIYVFVAEEHGNICGFIVLTEMACPWNSKHRYLTDLLFLASKGGIKLIRTAKTLAKKKDMKSIVLSVSSKKERSDKFLNHIGQHIGGVYEIEV